MIRLFQNEEQSARGFFYAPLSLFPVGGTRIRPPFPHERSEGHVVGGTGLKEKKVK